MSSGYLPTMGGGPVSSTTGGPIDCLDLKENRLKTQVHSAPQKVLDHVFHRRQNGRSCINKAG
jgi:hypothetical protein